MAKNTELRSPTVSALALRDAELAVNRAEQQLATHLDIVGKKEPDNCFYCRVYVQRRDVARYTLEALRNYAGR